MLLPGQPRALALFPPPRPPAPNPGHWCPAGTQHKFTEQFPSTE